MTSPPPDSAGSSSAPVPATQLALAGWQAVLAAEHAAIYGYGVIGVHLSDAQQVNSAMALQETHRDIRDALMAQIAAAGATPAAPATFYAPAQPVVDAVSAQRWAAQLEQACAAGYRYVLTLSATLAAGTAAQRAPSAAELAQTRSQAIAGLSSAAVATSTWQALLTPTTPTVPFPGA